MMHWDQIKTEIQTHLGQQVQRWREHNPRRIYIDIHPDSLLSVAQFLFETLSARFIIASGVDTPRDCIEVLYHFDFQGLPQVLSLRVAVPKSRLEVDSLAPVIKGTFWIEQEIHELFGIVFKNHPDMKHLLLPEDWPEGNYPLRRDL